MTKPTAGSAPSPVSPSAPAEQHWQGEVWLGANYAVFRGSNGHSRPHAHYAHQLMLSSGAPLRVLIDGQPHTGHCLLVPSLSRHAFEAPGQDMLVVYAEPLMCEADRLLEALRQCPPEPSVICQRLAALPRRALDPRLETAIARLDHLLPEKVSATSLAKDALLSRSQLQRLFGAQAGLSIRRLVLWRRVHRAVGHMLQGETLTRAAHEAGFSDSAHFSRTMRQLFGIRTDLSLPHLRTHLVAK